MPKLKKASLADRCFEHFLRDAPPHHAVAEYEKTSSSMR
jgi:hypothetical protein